MNDDKYYLHNYNISPSVTCIIVHISNLKQYSGFAIGYIATPLRMLHQNGQNRQRIIKHVEFSAVLCKRYQDAVLNYVIQCLSIQNSQHNIIQYIKLYI